MSDYSFGVCYLCNKEKALCDGICAECASEKTDYFEMPEFFKDIFGGKNE